MESNHGHYQYVVTRTPWETVGHVIAQGWQDALGSGFGFGSTLKSRGTTSEKRETGNCIVS